MVAPSTVWGRDLLPRLAKPWTEGLRGLDRRAKVVVLATMGSVAARMGVTAFVGVFFVLVAKIPVEVVGLAFLVENVVRGLLAPLMGAWSDHIGRRPILLGSMAASVVVMPLFLLVRDPVGVIAWSVALGAAQSGSWPSASALLMDLTPRDRHQSVLALNYSGIAVGYTVGVLPAGFLARAGYGYVAAGSVLLYAFVILVLAWGLRGALPPTHDGKRIPLARLLTTAPRDRAFLGLAALAWVFPLGIGLIVTTLAIFSASAGLSEAEIGIVLAANGPLLALLAVPVNARIEKSGPYRFLPVAALVLAVSYALIAWQATLAVLVLATVVFTLGELVFSAALPAAVAALAPPGMRGAYQGSWVLVFAIASGSALLLSGVLKAWLDWPGTWLAWAALTILAGVALFFARPAFRRVADARRQA